MISPLSLEIFYIELWHFLALVVILTVNTLLYRYAEKSTLLYRYLALQGALAVWVISKILKTAAPALSMRWFFVVCQYAGVSSLGPLFFSFAWQYVFRKALPLFLSLPVWLISGAFILTVATNPLHYLFYASFTFRRDSFGPLFFLFQGFSYSLILGGIILVTTGIIRRRRSAWDTLIAAAALLPLAGNIAYIYDLMPTIFDYTPLFMTSSLIFFGLAVFRSSFLGIVPIARETLLLHLNDPVILTDRKGKIVAGTGLPGVSEIRDRIEINDRFFKLYREKKSLRGSIYHYVDITHIEELHRQLAQQNSRLTLAAATLHKRYREQVSRVRRELLNHSRRELHDILGHSLTQVICLLRLALESSAEKKKLLSQLKQCTKILIRSMDELKNTLKGEIRDIHLLSIPLRETVDTWLLSQTRLELTVRGSERSLPAELVGSLLRNCQEAITNAVKHGKATKINIALLYGPEKLALIIADNGCGFIERNDGNGLSFMHASLQQHRGTLSVWSAPDEGCQLTLRLPYP